MRNNRTVTWILAVALGVVWGAVGYRVIDALVPGGEENDSAPAQRENNSSAPADRYLYRDDVRDPFRSFSFVRADSTKRLHPKRSALVWTPPPIRLTGILFTKDRKSATLQTQQGGVYFLLEGDTPCGTSILRIERQKVAYLYLKKRYEWILERP